MKIAAVVVTFNRKKLLAECLESLENQTRALDEIFVIDNASRDGTDTEIPPQFPNVTYIRLSENRGGAGGFHEGVKRAYKAGYDWIWIMDDDCELPQNSLELLTQSKKYTDSTAALANLKRDEEMNILYKHASRFYFKAFRGEDTFYQTFDIEKDTDIPIDYSSFIGILVNRKAIEKVGFPEEKLFLQYDDVEYSFRIRRFGEIFLVPKSNLIHKEKNNYDERLFLGKKHYRTKIEGIWKDYYGMRNIFIFIHNHHIPSWRIINIVIYFIKTIIGVILIDSHKMKRIYIYGKGFFDGLCKKYGKRVEPGCIPFSKKNV